MVPLTLAFGASVAWGASDYLGGLASRRLSVLVVLFGAQAVGLALAWLVWLATGAEVPGARTLLLGAGAGVAELAGFFFLFRGMAVGEMSVVAPLAALTGVLPVAAALASGRRLATVEAVGMVMALSGTALAARGEGGGRLFARGAHHGLLAALAFGAFLLGLGAAGEAGAPGAVLAGRLASVTILGVAMIARAGGTADGRGAWRILVALGALDVLANLAYAGAAAEGEKAVIAVLASLYPLTTVLLARALLGERLGPARAIGVCLVLCGIGALSAGSA